MQGRSIKYKRGTIWYCIEDDFNDTNLRRGFKTHVQCNTRPVLIVSSDYGNTHSPILNVVPLTTQDKRGSVAVSMVDENNTYQCILCNQIKTVDVAQLTTYISSVDDATMAEVERVINYTLGMEHQRIEKSLNGIEAIVKDIVAAKFNEVSSRTEIDSMVESIARSLENTYKDLMMGYIDNLNTSSKRAKGAAPELSKITESRGSQKTKQESVETKKSDRKPNGYWTVDRKKQFLQDYNEKSEHWMMSQYAIGTIEQLNRRYHQIKHDLKKLCQIV